MEPGSNPIDVALRGLFGGSRTALARALGVDDTTLGRQMVKAASGGHIPGPTLAALSAWILLASETGLRPPAVPHGLWGVSNATIWSSPTGSEVVEYIDQSSVRLFGPRPKMALTRALGVDASTWWRQSAAGQVPGPIFCAVKAWVLRLEMSGQVPPGTPEGAWKAARGRIDLLSR